MCIAVAAPCSEAPVLFPAPPAQRAQGLHAANSHHCLPDLAAHRVAQRRLVLLQLDVAAQEGFELERMSDGLDGGDASLRGLGCSLRHHLRALELGQRVVLLVAQVHNVAGCAAPLVAAHVLNVRQLADAVSG